MLTLAWLALGLALGGLTILFGRRAPRFVLGGGLVTAALIYVGFAIAWGTPAWIGIELAGVAAYGVFAALMNRTMLWVAAGWALHPVWDVALHWKGPGHALVPEWYAVACVAFDLLVAGWIVWWVRRGAGSGGARVAG